MRRPLAEGVLGHASFEIREGERVTRRRLDRWWSSSLDVAFGRPCDDRYRPLVVIGVNPSDADGECDDPTIAKCTKYARREGANGLVMVNLHPAITPRPHELASMSLPYGSDERHWEAVDGALSEGAVAVVAAWGRPPRGLACYSGRVQRVIEIARDVGVQLMCFGVNGDGSPKHPLYLADSTPLEPWRAR